jgi:two-component system response regulator FixJ
MMQNEDVVHVIDDEEAIRESLAFLLESEELEVHTYESANAFLESLPHGARGCIVTDIRMPGVSGIELLRQLRTMGVAIPVIVISGHADHQMVAEAMNSGALDCFKKPFDDDTFLSAIHSALRRPATQVPTLTNA